MPGSGDTTAHEDNHVSLSLLGRGLRVRRLNAASRSAAPRCGGFSAARHIIDANSAAHDSLTDIVLPPGPTQCIISPALVPRRLAAFLLAALCARARLAMPRAAWSCQSLICYSTACNPDDRAERAYREQGGSEPSLEWGTKESEKAGFESVKGMWRRGVGGWVR